MRLLRYSDADLDLTTSLETDAAVMGHLGGAASVQRARNVHAKRLAGMRDGDWYRTIVPDGAHRPVGVVAIWRWRWRGEMIAELGVMLTPDGQRKGIAFEAASLLIGEVRAVEELRELHGFTAVGNAAADSVGRRLGFVLDGVVDLDYEGEALRCNHWIMDVPQP